MPTVIEVGPVLQEELALCHEAKALWGKINHLELGRIFAKLRAKTENYKKGDDGMTYNQAVIETTVPWTSAEFYRHMAETCDAAKIPTPVFLALHDAGVNLSAKRYKGVLEDEDILDMVRRLDTNNAEAVSKEVTDLRGAFKAPPTNRAPEPLPAEVLAVLEKDKQDVQTILAQTDSERAKEALQEELESLEEDIQEIRGNLKAKIEAAAKELAGLISAAQPSDLPDPTFWATLDAVTQKTGLTFVFKGQAQ